MILNRIKSLLRSKLDTLYFFYRYIGSKIFILLLFNLTMVLFDSVGLSLFVPLLQIGDSGAVTPNDKLTRFTVDVFEFFGLPFSTLSLLLIIALVFLLKSFVVYFGLQYYKRTLRLMTRDIRVELALAVQNLSFKEFTLTDVGRMQNSLLGEAQVVVSACSSYLDAIKHGM